MFMDSTVLDWRIDGGTRLSSVLTNNYYILNTNRMCDITDQWQGHSKMRFYDNIWDSRDGGAWLTLWGDKANIPLAADTDHGSEMVTVNYYPDDDETATPVAITIEKKMIAFAWPKGHTIAATKCYLHYVDAGWNMRRILVNHTKDALFALLEA